MMKTLLYICVISLLFFTGCSNNQENLTNEIKNKKVLSNDFIDETALHDAIRAKDLEIVKELLNAQKQFDTQDKYGYTPLHLAARLDLYEVAQLLIKKGANVNNVDAFKDTPLIDSTRNSTNVMSRLLLCNGAKREVSDMHKMKPIHNASKNNDLYIVKMIRSEDISILCQKLDITLDEYNKDENKICGNIVKGIVNSVKIVIADENSEELEPVGIYDATIENNRYCAQLDKKLSSKKEYLITATGINDIDKDIEVSNLKDITKKPKISSLYKDLMQEFGPDFEPWNAELDKNGLVFRFKKPGVLFTMGSSDIRISFQDILSNFFPRYMKIIDKYKEEINEIIVEGHTSSEFSTAKNDEERYAKNKILSQKRAKEVFDYSMNQENQSVLDNKEWLNDHYSHTGKAYDNLIYDENGVEDINLSRRVEFRINKLF